MAVYRFKISFEDYDDIVREIDLRSNQTFEDLHFAIHRTTGYKPDQPSSFYVSSDQWLKGEEIAYLPSQRKIDSGVALMSNSKLSSFIDDPHQKFYYTYNFERPYDFHVELIKILLEAEPGKQYPFIVRTAGEAPKPPGTISATPPPVAVSDEFDFLNDMEYSPEDTEDIDNIDKMEAEDEEVVPDEEEEKDEFIDEFSDNENPDQEDFTKEDF
jgi:hypothetical protein